MKYAIISILSICCFYSLHGQNTYTQQDVYYEIEASYVDTSASLDVSLDIYYHNNSQVALDTIFLHLWMNALKDKNSPFAKQLLNFGSKYFYFSKPENRGGYTSIEVKVDDKEQNIGYLDPSEEIMFIPLTSRLQPGDSISIHIDYRLKMPKLYSRMGVTDKSIQLIHWYPRVCVYDANGWNRFPYLSLGEFYGEVSHFMVQLDMPKEYILSSTGALTGMYEIDQDIVRYQYEIDNVVDFAVIGSKKHTEKLSKMVKSISGKQVELISNHSGEDKIWSKSLEFLEEAFHFMEENVSAYPYDHLTLAETEKRSCGGMEYPCMLAIGCSKKHKDLEYYIIHEVAHQWFYGILAFNERKEPWLDEGLATYYENRYTTTKYGIDHYSDKLRRLRMDQAGMSLQQYALIHQMRRQMSESITTDLLKISPVNYGFGAYVRPSLGFKYLETKIGLNVFDQVMKNFVKEWQHKHPSTHDLQTAFQSNTGEQLDWLFTDWMQTDKSMDYTIQSGDKNGRLVLENEGQLSAPIKISTINNELVTDEIWIDGFVGKKEIDLGVSADKYMIDKEIQSIDSHPENNGMNTQKGTKIYFYKGMDNPNKRELILAPIIGYNRNDGSMLGLGMYNSSLGVKNFKFALAPFYGLSSKSLVGDSWMSYTQFLNNNKFKTLVYKINAKSFHYQENQKWDYRLRYIKLQPSVSLHMRHAPGSKVYSKASYRYIYLNEERAQFEDGKFSGKEGDVSGIHELSYQFQNKQAINPFSYKLALEQQSYKTFGDDDASYVKLTGEYRTSWTMSAKKSIDIRFFGGYFLSNSERESSSYSNELVRGSIAMIHQGFNDYRYDDYFFGRGMLDANFTSQTSYVGGGFKTPFGSSYPIGQSNNFATAINIISDTPINFPLNLPLKLFADFGYFSYKSTNIEPLKNIFLYSAGISFGNEYFQVNLPLVNSQQIGDLYQSENKSLLKRFSFSFNLNKLNTWDFNDYRNN